MGSDYTGKHRALPRSADGQWQEAEDAFWDAARDYMADRHLSEPARERLIRAARTLLQGAVSAAVVAAAPAAWSVLQDRPTDARGAAYAAATAALASVVAFFHTRRG